MKSENNFKLNDVAYEVLERPMDLCDGCVFINDTISCYAAPGCSHRHRADGRSVIWIRSETQPGETSEQLQMALLHNRIQYLEGILRATKIEF